MSKVTVIIPAYNAERFIAETIKSVLAQSLTDWELIIVDDGSTDGTPDILAGFTDPRIKVVRKANGGAASARNTGLDTMTGAYVAFLDADDLYMPDALGEMSAYLNVHPEADALFSDGYYWNENNEPQVRLSRVRPGLFTGNILEPLVLDATVLAATMCVLTRSEAIKVSGVRFDPDLVIGEDWDFWIQLARFARFDYLDRATCMYRIHNTNTTLTSGSTRRRLDLVRGRLKVMNADWFQELSPSTRREFFYHLLIGLLGNNPEQQDAILKTPAFESLASDIQSDVLRLVASYHLGNRQYTEFALQCLKSSLTLQPDNLKSHTLLRLASQSPSVARVALSILQVAHRTRAHIRSFGKRRPKLVPTALLPASE